MLTFIGCLRVRNLVSLCEDHFSLQEVVNATRKKYDAHANTVCPEILKISKNEINHCKVFFHATLKRVLRVEDEKKIKKSVNQVV